MFGKFWCCDIINEEKENMKFREFSEFDDPESADYDIISSLRENETAKENKHAVLTREQKNRKYLQNYILI